MQEESPEQQVREIEQRAAEMQPEIRSTLSDAQASQSHH